MKLIHGTYLNPEWTETMLEYKDKHSEVLRANLNEILAAVRLTLLLERMK